MKGEAIDPRITPGTLITLTQRMKYIPKTERELPGFRLEDQVIPVWRIGPDGRAKPYEFVPFGSLATVIDRYVKNEVTKFEVLIGGTTYHCYGTHADLVE